jgi:hypothetical protein
VMSCILVLYAQLEFEPGRVLRRCFYQIRHADNVPGLLGARPHATLPPAARPPLLRRPSPPQPHPVRRFLTRRAAGVVGLEDHPVLAAREEGIHGGSVGMHRVLRAEA